MRFGVRFVIACLAVAMLADVSSAQLPRVEYVGQQLTIRWTDLYRSPGQLIENGELVNVYKDTGPNGPNVHYLQFWMGAMPAGYNISRATLSLRRQSLLAPSVPEISILADPNWDLADIVTDIAPQGDFAGAVHERYNVGLRDEWDITVPLQAAFSSSGVFTLVIKPAVDWAHGDTYSFRSKGGLVGEQPFLILEFVPSTVREAQACSFGELKSAHSR